MKYSLIVLLWKYFCLPLNYQSTLLALVKHTASCDIVISEYIPSHSKVPYTWLATKDRVWMNGWIDGWQWMKKSKFYTSGTLQQVYISFQLGNEMEKDAPPMINLTTMNPAPEIPSWSLFDISWVWRKRKWKTLCLWFSEISPFCFTII